MATKTFSIQSYQLAMARQMSIGGGGSSGAKFYSYILCRSSDGIRFSIYFLTPTSNQLPNVYNPSAKWATMYLPEDQMERYLNVLQNEKPVYAYLNSTNPLANRIYTGQEPIGEEES